MSTPLGCSIPHCTKPHIHAGIHPLTSRLRGGPTVKRRRLDSGDEVCGLNFGMLSDPLTAIQRYSQIDLEDLHNNESSAGIVLDMQDRQRYFDGRANGAGQSGSEEPVND